MERILLNTSLNPSHRDDDKGTNRKPSVALTKTALSPSNMNANKKTMVTKK